jgi:hypothetical protein
MDLLPPDLVELLLSSVDLRTLWLCARGVCRDWRTLAVALLCRRWSIGDEWLESHVRLGTAPALNLKTVTRITLLSSPVVRALPHTMVEVGAGIRQRTEYRFTREVVADKMREHWGSRASMQARRLDRAMSLDKLRRTLAEKRHRLEVVKVEYLRLRAGLGLHSQEEIHFWDWKSAATMSSDQMRSIIRLGCIRKFVRGSPEFRAMFREEQSRRGRLNLADFYRIEDLVLKQLGGLPVRWPWMESGHRLERFGL